MELNENTKVIAMWFLNFDDTGNIMVTLTREDEQSDWNGELRVRSYVDDKNFESNDKKSTHGRTWNKDMKEKDVIKSIDTLLDLYRTAYKPNVDDYLYINGSSQDMMKVLETKDWANMKKLDLDNEEDMEYARKLGIDVDELRNKKEGVGDNE